MTTLIAKFITKKILAEKITNNFGTEDPYFESVPATRLDGTPTGKVKKRKKAIPPGVSEHDAKVLTKVKRRAWRLDMCLFSICGLHVGWGSAIAIVPAIGDAIDALMALMVYRTCCGVEDGLPGSVKTKMMLNIIVDFALGLVPFIGDVADAAFRCNTKNAVLLEEHLREKGKKMLKKKGLAVPTVDPSDSEVFDRMREEVQESEADAIDRPPQRSETMSAGHQNNGRINTGSTSVPNNPKHGASMPAKPKTSDRQRSGRWFGWGRQKNADVEMGH